MRNKETRNNRWHKKLVLISHPEPMKIIIIENSINSVVIRSQQLDRAIIDKIPIPYPLAEILELGENWKFPKRIFIFGGKRKEKTPVTHFYKIKSKYSQNEIGNRKR